MDHASNVWAELENFGDGVSGRRIERIRGETLAAAVWELAPGTINTYHFHHGARELLLVLRGRLSLRTHEGERELSEGDAIAFPRGQDGAHGQSNRSDEPVRYLVVAYHDSPDVIEYPDDGTLGVFALTTSESGERLEAFFHAKDAFQRDQFVTQGEDAALTTARALQEISGHWNAVYEAMRRRDESQLAAEH